MFDNNRCQEEISSWGRKGLLRFARPPLAGGCQKGARPVKKDIRYVPTPPAVVEGILTLARVCADDVFHDLGCGDGRLVIAAAHRGARAIGTEIDPSLVARCREGAAQEGVAAEFRLGNMHEADLRDASVVTLYLYSSVNLALRPKLRREMRPGTRLVSHSFTMDDWEPDEVVEVDTKLLHLWIL